MGMGDGSPPIVEQGKGGDAPGGRLSVLVPGGRAGDRGARRVPRVRGVLRWRSSVW